MKLLFTGKAAHHFSCAGVNLSAGDVGSFSDEQAEKLMRDYPGDFEKVETSDKDLTPKDNKMAKKTAKFKSK